MGDELPASVLVIDDEKSQRNMLLFALREKGYLVTVTESGAQAVEKARNVKFDVAICDIMMPGLGGVDTLKALKKIQPRLEVIMATGYGTAESALASMKSGAHNYITKPYQLKDLLAIIERALQRTRADA